MHGLYIFFFFFKQKTAYEIYQCDWSSDVCSSDLALNVTANTVVALPPDGVLNYTTVNIAAGATLSLDRKSVV